MGCHFCGHDQTIKSAYVAVSYFQIGVIRFDSAKVCYRCITAAQGSAATVRFGSEGRSEATYQVRIPEQSTMTQDRPAIPR